MDIEIREGKLSDAPDLAALISELGYETTSAEMESCLISILKDPRYKTLVAQIEGKICGMLGTVSCIELFAQRFKRANHCACRFQRIATAWHRHSVNRSGRNEFHPARNHPSDSDYSLRTRKGTSILRESRLCTNRLPVCKKSEIPGNWRRRCPSITDANEKKTVGRSGKARVVSVSRS